MRDQSEFDLRLGNFHLIGTGRLAKQLGRRREKGRYGGQVKKGLSK